MPSAVDFCLATSLELMNFVTRSDPWVVGVNCPLQIVSFLGISRFYLPASNSWLEPSRRQPAHVSGKFLCLLGALRAVLGAALISPIHARAHQGSLELR